MAVYALALVSAVLSLSVPGESVCWENLHVKYALLDGFYDIPKTVTGIQEAKYVKMAHDDDLNVDLYALPDDPRVSILFDTFGNIAGVRTAYIKDDLPKQAKANNVKFQYNYDNKPIFTSGKYFGIDVWYTSILFADPEKLKAGGRKETNGQLAENIYMKLDGVWTKIPKDECKATSVGFTKQGCFIGMGMHYFYKLTPKTDCNDIQGAYALYEGGELIGVGMNAFGSFTSGKDREWFERIAPAAVRMIIPNGPSCLKKTITNYGGIGLHMSFKKFPRLTFCTWPWQRSDQCTKK